MSLKTFHIVFIVFSTALAVALGLWASRDFAQTGSWINLTLAVGSFIVTVLLLVYGAWFLRKLKNLGYL